MKIEAPVAVITSKIYSIRGQKVMLDRDLAQLYGVETRVLNQAVSRNVERFPADFMFALDRDAIKGISQTVTSSGIKYSNSVRAFTECEHVQISIFAWYVGKTSTYHAK